MTELDHQQMWSFLRELLGRVGGALGGGAVMADGLDGIVELLKADRGLVFVAEPDGTFQAVVGRRQRRPMEPLEREEIGKTLVRQALETGRYVSFDRVAQANISASAHSLGIAAAVFGICLEQELRAEQARDELTEAKRHSVHARAPVDLEALLGFPNLARLREDVDLAIRSRAPVLVLGESGSGKTMLAHAIAEASGRRPVVRVMLGASDDLNTISSELFGHERGAFTGATTKRVGLVEYANGGTLVLDELLNLPPPAQRLLLDFVQFGTFRPLGWERHQPKSGDVRIIAATNGDIRAAMRDGRLREDLYHRLAHFELEMPPLRARREDVPRLAERFSSSAMTRRANGLSSPTLAWPGNIRQLERVVQRARERAVRRDPEAHTLLVEHLDERDLGTTSVDVASRMTDGPIDAGTRWQRLQSTRTRLDEEEKEVLREALGAAGGVVARAARDLGIARTTLSSRLDALGLRAPREG